MFRFKKTKIAAIVGLFLVFVFFSTFVTYVVDWWWFLEVGHTQIFIKTLVAKIALFLVVGTFSAAFIFYNLFLAVRSQQSWTAVLPAALIGRSIQVNSRLVMKMAAGFSLICAFLFGLGTIGNWHDVLKFLSGVSFGTVDPIFNKDIGFYIFTMPIVQIGLDLAKILVLLTFVLCTAIYFLRNMLGFSNASVYRTTSSIQLLKQLQIKRWARIHLGSLLAIFLLTVAVGTYLDRFSLLTGQTGLVAGVTFTDATVRIVLLWISIIAALLAAVGVMVWAWSGKVKSLIGAVAIYLVVGLAGTIVTSLFQKVVVAPNELVKEMPFIKNNISATRQAFGLDKIEEREISGDKPITETDIAANHLTVKNVRLWDREPLLSTFSQIQEIRTYYEFGEIDDDRYIIDGEIRQIMLSPRELASSSLPNGNWINERLTFTHGYGIAAGPVNQVTPEGLPVLFVKDLPPQSDVSELEISRPEIYFGEVSNEYVITNTQSLEFDYPKGEENVYATYAGTGGVEMNSFVKRVFYAVKFRSLKLLLSNDITSQSRIMYHRTITERVQKIAPFLTLDGDPYSVIADGKVYWILDAYTTSDGYPYSQPLSLNGKPVNYVRNSVKVVVDAYHGTVDFYQADLDDPIIKTYAAMFPGTFRPLSEIPQNLAAHLRYPEDIFSLQTAAYSVYHMDDPQIFYNKEDQWEIPAIPLEGEDTSTVQLRGAAGAIPAMEPRHIIMKLPGEESEEYVLMLPFTPRAKDNLSAWMVARSDGESYGKLLVYHFPKDKLVFGPKQIIGRINQHPEISQQISLWSQGGSHVIQGPLLVIPIEESLLYVRPLYLKAEDGKIPELKRVVVAYENKIAMAETLEEGLSQIFGSGAVKQSEENAPVTPPDTGELTQDDTERIKSAIIAYEEALQAQMNGDWALYGETIERLGEILKQ